MDQDDLSYRQSQLKLNRTLEGKGKGKGNETRACYICGKTGHLAKDCYYNPKGKGKGKGDLGKGEYGKGKGKGVLGGKGGKGRGKGSNDGSDEDEAAAAMLAHTRRLTEIEAAIDLTA